MKSSRILKYHNLFLFLLAGSLLLLISVEIANIINPISTTASKERQ